jgi:hypothetical protein
MLEGVPPLHGCSAHPESLGQLAAFVTSSRWHACCTQVLGGGLDLVTVGARTYIRSVPVELNTDVNRVLELAEVGDSGSSGVGR